jgi:hypothetical protein
MAPLRGNPAAPLRAKNPLDGTFEGKPGPAELIGGALYDSAARHRTRYLAIYELTLEATRRPALAEALSGMVAATLDVTIGRHRALGLDTSPAQVQAMITLFSGALLTLGRC